MVQQTFIKGGKMKKRNNLEIQIKRLRNVLYDLESRATALRDTGLTDGLREALETTRNAYSKLERTLFNLREADRLNKKKFLPLIDK